MMNNKEKAREVTLRNTLYRRGYRLRRSKRRDEKAPDYGNYWIDRKTETGEYEQVAGGEYGMPLDEVIRWVEEM